MSPYRTGFSPDAAALILARSGGHCEVMVDTVCVQTATTIHHRQPRGMGGRKRDARLLINQPSNGLAVCDPCHAYVERRRAWAREYGFIVSQFAEPGLVPVWWRRGNYLVLLDDSGEIHRTSDNPREDVVDL